MTLSNYCIYFMIARSRVIIYYRPIIRMIIISILKSITMDIQSKFNSILILMVILACKVVVISGKELGHELGYQQIHVVPLGKSMQS